MLTNYFPVLLFIIIGLVVGGSLMVVLAILVVGFVYEWKKGALDWE
jgi:NADH-quinone oxidoreductase subunit A